MPLVVQEVHAVVLRRDRVVLGGLVDLCAGDLDLESAWRAVVGCDLASDGEAGLR